VQSPAQCVGCAGSNSAVAELYCGSPARLCHQPAVALRGYSAHSGPVPPVPLYPLWSSGPCVPVPTVAQYPQWSSGYSGPVPPVPPSPLYPSGPCGPVPTVVPGVQCPCLVLGIRDPGGRVSTALPYWVLSDLGVETGSGQQCRGDQPAPCWGSGMPNQKNKNR